MTYYVDTTDHEPGRICPKCGSHFSIFPTLKAASKYAEKHGYETIVGPTGDTVKPWKSRRELEGDLADVKAIADAYKEAVKAAAAQTKEDAKEHEARMLQAGYIPLETFRSMVDRNVTGDGRDGYSEYNLTVRVRDTDARAANILNAIVNGRP